QDAQQGRLARPVRAEQPGDPPHGVERHAVQRRGPAEALPNLVHTNDRFHHWGLLVSKASRRATVRPAHATPQARKATCSGARNSASGDGEATSASTTSVTHRAATPPKATGAASDDDNARPAAARLSAGNSHAAA